MLRSIAFWALFAACIPQALWVRRTAPRFGGAPGPRSGRTGAGPTLRLVGLGDSVIDGVGCASLRTALVGRIADSLASALDARVDWSVAARSGADTCRIRSSLLPDADIDDADFVVVSTGVNDVTGLTRIARYRSELAALLAGIRERAPEAVVAVNGLPPMHRFPALPQPLRAALGLRARQLDREVEAVARAMPGVRRVPLAFESGSGELAGRFASDGYHPSEATCGELAKTIAELLIDARNR